LLLTPGSPPAGVTVVIEQPSGAPTATVQWTSDNPAVASVVASGATAQVTGVAPGVTTIRARATAPQSAGFSAVTVTELVAVTVAPPTVASVNLTLESARLIVGEATTATAALRDQGGGVVTGRPIIWTTSAPQVAVVRGDGPAVSIAAIAPGTATITATSEGRSGSAILTVTAVPVQTVSVTLTPSTVTAGGMSSAVAELRDAGGAVLTGRAVSWESSNPEVATVSGSGGSATIRSVAPGTATITATSEGRSGTARLTVNAVPVASLSLALTHTGLMVGGTATASATLRDSVGNALTGRAIAWQSSNPSVVSVSGSGASVTLVAVAPGTASITATSEGRSATTMVTVTPVPVASVTLALAQGGLLVGTTTTATATARDSAGTALTGRTITWQSSSPGVASVSGSGATVTLVAVAPGTTTITATSEGRSASALLTVAAVPVASVSLALAQGSLLVGATTIATATTRDSVGNPITGRAIIWQSSNPGVASVSGSGASVTLVAVAPGSATITATSEGRTGNAFVTVTAAPAAVQSVSVTLSEQILRPGGSTVAVATLRAADGSVLTGRPVTWSTSNAAVATVSGSGSTVTVVSLAAGTANITATSEGRSSSVPVTVCVWCNTTLTFDNNAVPAGWQVGRYGPNQGRIANGRLEVMAVDQGLVLRAPGPVPSNARAIEIETVGPMADVYFSMRHAARLETGSNLWESVVFSFTCPTTAGCSPNGASNRLFLQTSRLDGYVFPQTATGSQNFYNSEIFASYQSGTVVRSTHRFEDGMASVTVRRASDNALIISRVLSLPGFRVSSVTAANLNLYFTSISDLPVAWLDDIRMTVIMP
jgi:uncharacterized protein YjdB